jgi:thiol-disulfide isomerase/thioredoxin
MKSPDLMKEPLNTKLAPILVAVIAIALLALEAPNVGRCEASLQDFQLFQPRQRAADIKMLTPDGAVFRLSDLKGRVVLLNFWRKDCPYCVQEKAFLRRMAQSINSSDLKIVCVNFWDSPAWVKSYARNIGQDIVVAARPSGMQSVIENVVKGRFMGYFILNDANEAVYEVKGFPSTYVIDRQGFVVASHLGMAQWATRPVEKWIRTLLADMGTSSGRSDAIEKLEQLLTIRPASSEQRENVSPVARNQQAQ